jgi:hypothetical protein
MEAFWFLHFPCDKAEKANFNRASSPQAGCSVSRGAKHDALQTPRCPRQENEPG